MISNFFVYTNTLPTGIMVAKLERDISQTLSAEVRVQVLTREKIAGMKNTKGPFIVCL
ncbi:MAG: hypothetical protein NTV68_16340 [Methanomicrobiales archaeon]|nr:hypothetical protein [Methanomicrobiales archaeon]